jgi:lauroyl/myristoyl acyltransferase
MSAGLFSKFKSAFIVERFDALQSCYELVWSAERALLDGCRPNSIRGLSGVQDTLADLRSRNVILAACQYGASAVAIAALSSMGVKIASLYWTITKRYLEILEPWKVPLIDMTKQESTLSVLKKLRTLHAEGYTLFLLSDAPGRSRKRYQFLGYDVTCSNLIEIYARYNDCVVVPFQSEVISDREVSLHCGAPHVNCPNLMQKLLSDVEELIYRNHTNYLWSGGSIIFSDSRALPNGLRFLSEYLDWRDRSCSQASVS